MGKQVASSSDPFALQDVSLLKGVGPRVAEKLHKLGISTLQDLLFHLPFRYQDRTRVVPVGSLRPGDEAVIEGEVELTEVAFGRRRMLLSRLSDGTGSILLRFFHFSAAQQANLGRGTRLRCYGEVRAGKTMLEMIHPEYRSVDAEHALTTEDCLTPIYPTTEGVHQLKLRDLTEQVLYRLRHTNGGLQEWLPDEVLKKLELPSLQEAVLLLHRPPPDVSLQSLEQGTHPAQVRLAFEELLAHHLSLRQLRARVQQTPAPVLPVSGQLQVQFLQGLAFELTGAQQRVIHEIQQDISRPLPMLRLVQGDVGSGKTVVAAAAALSAFAADYQVALMAPTELLAEQHFRNFQNWFHPLGIEVGWLSGKLKASERKRVLSVMQSGDARMVVGTHALFQEEVRFDDLALVIIDEQHRFGVHQRLALREKGSHEGRQPHQLIMTATPIPRTLAMTAYADLDLSIIDELPPGRKPVTTVVLPESRRDEVVLRVRNACASGSQAYWVCTLIEESEVLQCQAAEDTAAQLHEALPELRVALVHGRMKAADKEEVMARFKAGDVDLLVATTVIEVGVDVPNASVMIIENAERLGLAQLHQLRGRVGRGTLESSCVLMYHGPLSQMARQRLAVMRETNDGFVIAQKDLEIRGPGEVLGTRQTGMLQLRVADILRDQPLMPAVHEAAKTILQEYPDRVAPLVRRWLGESLRYGDV
jgi:ATP-dependent DNA helicase RecG